MKAVRYFIAVLSFMAVLLDNNNLIAQCQPDWEWTKGIKGDGIDDIGSMAVDKWNNIYIAGETQSSKLIIDSVTMTGKADYFIKFNSSGKLLWSKRIGGNIYGIVTDRFGNVYIAGLFSAGTITFDQVTLTKTAGNNFNSFLVKYSPDGNAIWGKKAYIASNGTILMYNNVLAIDTTNNNIVLSGSYGGDLIKTGNIEIKHNTITPYSSTEAFFFVYDTAGNVKWGKSAYSKNPYGYVDGSCVGADNKGNIYLSGFFVYNMQADTFSRNGSDAAMYVIKYDNKGNVKWIKNATKGQVFSNFVHIDKDYNVLVCGNMYDTGLIQIENYSYKIIGQAGYIMKADSSGNIKWFKEISGSIVDMKDGYETVSATTTDHNGNIFVIGTYRGDSLFIDDYHFSKLCTDATGNEFFCLKMDPEGNYKWLKRVQTVTDTTDIKASFQTNYYSKIITDHVGSIIVLNSWRYFSYSQGHKGIIVGKDTISTLSFDIFLAKIRNNLETSIKSLNTTCHGATNGFAKIYIVGGTPPYNIQWSNSSNQQEQSLGAGFYKVTVTDANNCIYQDSVEITEPPQLYISVTTKPDSANLKKGEASALVTGGTPPYTYLWNDAANQKTAKAIGLAKGSYKITVTDKNGCSIDTTITITSLVDIDELIESRISVFPNPVLDGLLNIDIQQLPQSMQLSLYDGTGRELITKSIPSNTNYQDQLKISGKGIYILKIQMAGKKFIKSIVVQ